MGVVVAVMAMITVVVNLEIAPGVDVISADLLADFDNFL